MIEVRHHHFFDINVPTKFPIFWYQCLIVCPKVPKKIHNTFGLYVPGSFIIISGQVVLSFLFLNYITLMHALMIQTQTWIFWTEVCIGFGSVSLFHSWQICVPIILLNWYQVSHYFYQNFDIVPLRLSHLDHNACSQLIRAQLETTGLYKKLVQGCEKSSASPGRPCWLVLNKTATQCCNCKR